ncbi:MAG: methylenetetrahydrofolate reductase [Candidatus Muiribacteriota bacterium]
MNKLKDLINNKKLVLSAELFAPKGIKMKGVARKVDFLKNHVDIFNVTDNQRATMRTGSLGICAWLEREKNVETVFQLNCRDRNRLALQSDLLSASLLGIKNVLVITGDHPSIGDHVNSKAVYDFDSAQLLQVIKNLNRGYDFSGNKLKGKPDILAGAAVNPCATPVDAHIMKFKKKISAGASFFQTQVIFEPEKYIEFYKKIKHMNVPVFAGISLLKNHDFAQFINNTVPGITIPDKILNRLKNTVDVKKERVEIACEIVEKLKNYVDGFHFMVFGLEKEIPVIIEKTSLNRQF